LTELELKTSLLSALEDKIRRFYFSKDQEEMDRQLYLNKVLMDGESTIRAGLRRLEDEKLVVGRSIDALCRSAEELRQMIAVQSATVEPGVDELVSPTDVIYKQYVFNNNNNNNNNNNYLKRLMECMAEDDAIEDTIYYVGKALAAGRVDLPSFMKCIRQLARDQFMRRALCFKIKRQLGI
jgi:ESCRT-I complex subunit TSG101